MIKSISKEELLKADFIMLVLTVLTMIFSGFAALICILSGLNLILSSVLSYSKESITGIKVFWVQGIQAMSLAVIFALLGTTAVGYIIERKYYVIFGIFMVICYLAVTGLYLGIILALIRKGAYSKTTKVSGTLGAIGFGVAGIFFAKMFLNDLDNQAALQYVAICAYFISFICTMGIFLFVKYYFLKKNVTLKES